MKKIILELTEDELRIVDNELYVAQCRILRNNTPSVENPNPGENHVKYKSILNRVRNKVISASGRENVEVNKKKFLTNLK
jgi:hypothetical protein|tara:strand:+ start:1309 stop:1548 length:240 start_codon:yes stop_codon:yes gene_type:complete